MSLVSSTDLFVLGGLACGTTAYISGSLLQKWRKPTVEPLIPHKDDNQTRSTRPNLPPTRCVTKALQQHDRQCIVFYGSQTGTAERLAYQFSKDAKSKFGLACLVADLDDYDFDDLLSLPKDKAAVFLLATYGEGEATDNAVSFDQYLCKLNDIQQSTLIYAGFGLGNSSYQHYNQMIKHLDRKLTGQGAQRVGNIGLGDDGKCKLEEEFLVWKDETLSQLASCFGLMEKPYQYEPSFQLTVKTQQTTADTFLGEINKRHLRSRTRGPWTLVNPYPAPLVAAHDLCPSGSRQFLHLEFDLSASTLTYEAGDHIAIRPINSDIEVERFLKTFGLLEYRNHMINISSSDSALKVPVPTPTTYDAVARYYLDICAPVTRQLLSCAATLTIDEKAKLRLHKLSTHVDLFKTKVVEGCLNIAQVLEMCDSDASWKHIPFSALLENIPIMKPRYYSISSSPAVSRKVVSITTVIESRTFSDCAPEFKGVATNYLLALSSPLRNEVSEQVPATHHISGPRQRYAVPTALVSIRRSKFKLPRDPSTPIIMIGPGTGVAPFRGFVQTRCQQRQEGKAVGRTMLFYGCRRHDGDFLYREEWQEAIKKLTPEMFSMHVAFSREPDRPKTYVQDLFADCADELRRLVLREDAHVYVCGNAHRMARDVFGTLAGILARDVGFQGSEEGARVYLKELKAQGRWLEDVW